MAKELEGTTFDSYEDLIAWVPACLGTDKWKFKYHNKDKFILKSKGQLKYSIRKGKFKLKWWLWRRESKKGLIECSDWFKMVSAIFKGKMYN